MYQSQFCLEELVTLKEKVKRFRDRLVYRAFLQRVNMKRNFLKKFFHRQDTGENLDISDENNLFSHKLLFMGH